MDGEESSDITVGFFRSGLERQAGWDSRTARVDMAGTVAMIDLRLPSSQIGWVHMIYFRSWAGPDRGRASAARSTEGDGSNNYPKRVACPHTFRPWVVSCARCL